MPVIRANRDSIDDRFSVLGFTIRTESPLFEVGVATDPALFNAANRAQRSRRNFFSSRGNGAIRARRGEAVYLLPAEVTSNFIGAQRLYFGLATYGENNRAKPEFVQSPSAGSMYVNCSGLTERGLRRLAARPAASSSYGSGNNSSDPSLDWGGDAVAVAAGPAAPPAQAPAAPARGKTNGAAAPAAAAPAAGAQSYSDGYGDDFWKKARSHALEDAADDDDAHGIDGPVPDDAAAAQSLSTVRALDTTAPEYPGASRFAPAAAVNYRRSSAARTVEHLVIHITDGGSRISGTIGWFQNPNQLNAKGKPIHVSAHYVVGQDGEVVQMVRNNDIAWHASKANSHGIGIEHVANTHGLNPTEAQYQASAALVAWLCSQFGLAADRDHIVGHHEISPQDNHDCPSRVWQWDHYMDLVRAAAAPAVSASQGLSVANQSMTRDTGTSKRQVAAQARAMVIGPEDVQQAQRYAPQWADLFNWKVPDWINSYLNGRKMRVQKIEDAAGELNLDRYEVRISSLPTSPGPFDDVALLNYIRTNINKFLDTRNSEFIPYAVGDDDVKWTSSSPVGTVFKIDIIGPDNAAVVASLVEERRWRFTTIHTEWSGDHPVSGHREFGVRSENDGTVVVYTRGADRATDGVLESLVFAGGDNLWRSFQRKLTDWVNANGGSASAPEPFSQRFHPAVVRILYGGATAQGLSTARALAGQCYSVHWDTVPYYSQQSDRSCWAAAAAMVVAWRDGITLSDADIAAKVPLVESYWNGLLPKDRRVLADLWNLVPEPPASYTIAAWRNMLENYGPLFLDMTNSAFTGGHAWVLIGMTSDGAEDGSDTVMYLHNPWPSKGRVKWKFPDFLKLYEGRVGTEGNTLECQILHAASIPAGRSTVTAAPFSLGLAAVTAAPTARKHVAAAHSLASNDSDYNVPLIPQPNKDACWAASMAMLLSFRRNASYAPETLASEVGGSLMSSYDWPLLDAVKQRYGFVALEQPSNTSLYFSAAQWAGWLRQYGPLWVVIVGMPHAVVLAGIKGDLDHADSVQVKVLNPWDTRVEFDNDPVAFHPANSGYQGWMPLTQFTSDFGNMVASDYGKWRVLHLPAQAAAAQGLGVPRAAVKLLATPPAPVVAADRDDGSAPINPSRVPGTSMRTVSDEKNRVSWALEQLDGLKQPSPAAMVVATPIDTAISLDRWPQVGADAVPLPLTITFGSAGGAVGNVRIVPGAAADQPYNVAVSARIDDDPQPVPGSKPVASLRVTVEYRFSLPDGEQCARVQLRLLGNGRYDMDNAWA